MTEREEKCPWEETEEGSFRADCGGFFEFGDGTPSSNSFKFCPYCGKVIVEVPFVEDWDHDDDEERLDGRVMSEREEQRVQLIRRAHGHKAEVLQIYRDAERWNRLHPAEVPIDPDPDGDLLRSLLACERVLVDLLGIAAREEVS